MASSPSGELQGDTYGLPASPRGFSSGVFPQEDIGGNHHELHQEIPSRAGSKADLGNVDADFKDKHESHEHALPEIGAYNQKLHDLQYLFYAESKRSLLICL
jgi:hypothetical protein